MTLHVSLPKEMEQLVHDQVKTGVYGSASEVVREALRRFFAQPQDDIYERLFAEGIAEFEGGQAPRSNDIEGLFQRGQAIIDRADAE